MAKRTLQHLELHPRIPTAGRMLYASLVLLLVLVAAIAFLRLLWPQILAIDLMRQAPGLKVPVYFLEGRHDHEAPSVLAERYLAALQAPRKTLVWFEDSAHFVNTEEADAFNRFLVERLLPETRPPA